MLLAPEYFIGVDLGQKHDFTAIAVLEFRDGGPPHFLTPYDVPKSAYDLRHLERIALGTPYQRVVRRIAAITRTPGIAGRCTVVVDSTGVGQGVAEMLRDANLDCWLIPITITGGHHAHTAGRGKTVPKRDLISTLEVMVENQELRIAADLTERRRLVEELMAMRSGPTRSGATRFGASGRSHDDLVLAIALACWQAKKGKVGEQSAGRVL
jgi:transposase